MDARPLVSIVTPSYNQAAYLETAMRSVLEQDYPNIEYLVADGGSDDGSVEIIQSYASRLTWWVSEKDKGQADGANKGFRRARGEFVGWLNSDDVYHPGAIAGAVAAFQANPQAGMVFSDVDSIDGSGQLINVMRFGQRTLEDLMAFKIISQPGVFMRRSLLEQVGYLDPQYHLLLDHHLWLRMALKAPLIYVPGARWAAGSFPCRRQECGAGWGFWQRCNPYRRMVEHGTGISRTHDSQSAQSMGRGTPVECLLPAGWRSTRSGAESLLERVLAITCRGAAGLVPDFICVGESVRIERFTAGIP